MAKKRKRIVVQASYGGTLIARKAFIVPKNWDSMDSDDRDEYTDDLRSLVSDDIKSRMKSSAFIEDATP